MGFLGGLFGKNVKKTAKNTSFLGTYRLSSGRSYNGGGWGLDRFNAIIKAHSSVEGIIEHCKLTDEQCKYLSPDGYPNCYTQAYQEEYDKALILANVLSQMYINVKPKELVDMQEVKRKTDIYAKQLVNNWLNGNEWIPQEIMDWAFYTLSDHNRR